MSAEKSDAETLERVVKADGRYTRDAYLFVSEALRFTVERLDERRHVSGQELVAGIRDFAHERFGLMAPTVFERWGVRATEDFGEIVFGMVDAGLMTKQPTDSLDDFRGGFDFKTAFDVDYEVS